MRGLGRLQNIAKRIRREIAPLAVVLIYHRVHRLESDPWMLSVTPEHFAEQVEVLQRHSHVISLQELTNSLRRGKLPRRAVVITFDDGYADNLLTAKPLLEKYDLPATVFVATEYVGREREFWWDELDRIFLQPGSLPERLRLSVEGVTYEWELHDTSNYSPADCDRHRHWKPWHEVTPSPRQQVYHSLWKLMHTLPKKERLNVREALLAWAGSNGQARSTHRTLSGEEVAALAEGGLVEIGAHTVTHPMLSALPLTLQQDEIRQSKRYLEDILNRAVPSFAYPFGRPCDYTAETIAVVKESGFASACTTSEEVINRSTDLYQLPRIHAQDVSGEVFARQLDEWFCKDVPVV